MIQIDIDSKLFVGISTVADGNMSFVWGDEADVAKNRLGLIKKAQLKPDNLSVVQLEHGKKVVLLQKSISNAFDRSKAELIVTDAVATDRPGVALMLLVGDCIPAILYDKKRPAFVLIHAGRKGVEQNIIKESIDFMKRNFKSEPSELILASGPSIGKDSYVFDDPKAIDLGFWGQYCNLGDDHKYHLDVSGKFGAQASQAGLMDSNIRISPTDTFSDKNYFSHRRSMATGEPEGRFGILAYVKSS